jgi:tetratricopeptide (TPR) repeat protein
VLRRPLGHDSRDAPASAVEEPGAHGALEDALRAADKGDLEVAVETTARILQRDPLDADAYFIRGLSELGLGDVEAAARSLRRALYVDPTFGLAAFNLGRAHEARGDRAAASRAYDRALNTLTPGDKRHAAILDQVDIGDIAAACAIRRRALACSPRALSDTTGGH